MRHNIVEVICRHEAIVIQICLGKHLLQLLLSHVLPQILGHSLKLQDCDLSHLVSIEGGEYLVDIGPTILIAQFGCGQFQKFIEAYASGLVLIELGQDLIDKLILSAEAEIDEGLLEFLRVDGAAAVAVEDVEGQLDVLHLFERDGEGDVVFGVEAFFLWDFGCLLGGGSRRGGFDGRGWTLLAHSNIAVKLQYFQKTLAHMGANGIKTLKNPQQSTWSIVSINKVLWGNSNHACVFLLMTGPSTLLINFFSRHQSMKLAIYSLPLKYSMSPMMITPRLPSLNAPTISLNPISYLSFPSMRILKSLRKQTDPATILQRMPIYFLKIFAQAQLSSFKRIPIYFWRKGKHFPVAAEHVISQSLVYPLLATCPQIIEQIYACSSRYIPSSLYLLG